MKRTLLLSLCATSFAFAAEPDIISGTELARKWKRTKSLAAPVEKVRKGLEVEVEVEVEVDGAAAAPAAPKPVAVKVDADTACAFQNIQFERDSAHLMGGITEAQIVEIAKGMTAAGTEKFLIEGHTCDLGGDSHNVTLSQNRALAVKQRLITLGVPAERLQVIGFGEGDPLVGNTDETARQQNRRVQIFRKL